MELSRLHPCRANDMGHMKQCPHRPTDGVAYLRMHGLNARARTPEHYSGLGRC
jgi:hypothetical protein